MPKDGYDNTNSGAIFRNTRKESDRHPDMTGTLNVEGVEYWVSAWTKTSDRVEGKFLSLSIKPKDEKPARLPPLQQRDEPRASRKPAPQHDYEALGDDDIPF